MFEPENSLEALMQAAVKDPGVVPAFYQALLETEIYVLTPEAPVKPGRRRSLKFQEKINVAAVRNLFEMLPNSNFWLNPLSECQKPLPATEIALLMNGKIFEILERAR